MPGGRDAQLCVSTKIIQIYSYPKNCYSAGLEAPGLDPGVPPTNAVSYEEIASVSSQGQFKRNFYTLMKRLIH